MRIHPSHWVLLNNAYNSKECSYAAATQILTKLNVHLPVTVAARSKAWACGRSLAGIASSNPTGGVDACRKCCVLSGRGLCVGLVTRP